jgi:ubiquinone/menaquinone biosynthesis C-methylase UbiE
MHERRFTGDIARLRSPERVERLEVERVIQVCVEEMSYENMLDMGTGSGLFAEEFSKHNIAITGLDANIEMLPVAKNYVPQGNFVQATVEALPFADKSFDLAFFGLVLHEADEPLRVLQGARKATRKRVCLLEWPYREQTFGPPLSDRLNPEELAVWFKQTGFTQWECIRLDNVDLYRLEV